MVFYRKYLDGIVIIYGIITEIYSYQSTFNITEFWCKLMYSKLNNKLLLMDLYWIHSFSLNKSSWTKQRSIPRRLNIKNSILSTNGKYILIFGARSASKEKEITLLKLDDIDITCKQNNENRLTSIIDHDCIVINTVDVHKYK